MFFNAQALPMPWRTLVRHYPSTTSTMDLAAQHAREGATATPHLTLVIADTQTTARGRQGRTWTTFPAPHSFAGTFVIRGIPSAHLPLVVSLALHDALITAWPGLPVAIKWPNDILLFPEATDKRHSSAIKAPLKRHQSATPAPSGHKLAGILIENITGNAAEPLCLLGLGLNLQRPPAVPADFPGIFLADALPSGLEPPTREALLGALFPCLSNHLSLYATHGWAAFHHNYARHCHTIGHQVTWKLTDTQELRGLALGLHEQTGALMLQDEGGTVHLIHSGDVVAQGARPG